jgi:hypothetical protein
VLPQGDDRDVEPMVDHWGVDRVKTTAVITAAVMELSVSTLVAGSAEY